MVNKAALDSGVRSGPTRTAVGGTAPARQRETHLRDAGGGLDPWVGGSLRRFTVASAAAVSVFRGNHPPTCGRTSITQDGSSSHLVAGSSQGYKDGPAISAQFFAPQNVAFDSIGTMINYDYDHLIIISSL